MPRLLVVTPAELTRDPRARRAARTAQARGFGVVGLSGRISGEAPTPLPGVDVVRVGREGRTAARWETGAAEHREPAPLRELRGLARLARLALRTRALVAGGRTYGGVAVVHAHDFATLPAAFLLARENRARLVYDAHEVYAEFEPHPPRLARALALALEGLLARRADAVVTVSEPIADELMRLLRLRRRPLVVLNAPELDPAEPAPAAQAGNALLRAVYVGAFGTGRRLEDLLAAAESAPGVELTLRVPRADPEQLRRSLGGRAADGRLKVEAPVAPDELVAALRAYEVGVVFDRPLTLSAELSSPNKLFEYLMAGLAVVVPRLPGLTSLVEGEGVGVTYEPGRPEALAAALEELAADRGRLAELRRRARAVAVERYNAEAQSPALEQAWGRGSVPGRSDR